MKKMLDELRKIVSNDCDFTVDINPVDFRVNISREMWESNAFSVVYSGMSESPFLDVDDQCEELQYGETDTAISVFISLYVSWRD